MRFLLIVSLFFISISLYGQQRDAPLRIELELAKDAEDYHSAEIGERGVLVFYEGNMVGQDSTSWIFMHYDTNLRRTETFAVTMTAGIQYMISCKSHGHLYLFYQDQYQRKSIQQSYVLDIDLEDNSRTFHVIPGLTDTYIHFMEAAGKHLIFISYYKEKHSLYIYDLAQRQITVPELTTENIVAVEFCEIDTFRRKILWGIVSGTSKANALRFIETDYAGSLQNSIPFPAYSGYYYSSARLSVTDSVSSIILGTFVSEEDRNKNNLHTGVYTLPVKNGILGDPDFFKYSQIKNKDSISDKKYKDRGANLQVLVSDIFCHQGQYSLVSEIFYPEYSYNYGSSLDPYYYGYHSMPASSTFVGYRYINAYITTFDKEGHLVWDYYLPFTNILTQRLVQRVSIFGFHDNTVIYYPYNVSLTYTLIDGYTIIEPLTTIKMESKDRRDVVEYSRKPKFENWYGNYFLASGYQNIKNSSRSQKSKRYVFFLNKLEFR